MTDHEAEAARLAPCPIHDPFNLPHHGCPIATLRPAIAAALHRAAEAAARAQREACAITFAQTNLPSAKALSRMVSETPLVTDTAPEQRLGKAPSGEVAPLPNSCNRHDDCAKAKADAAKRGANPYNICCHNDECEECFGN